MSMKIAISANGKNLDAGIDPRFGRCACFIIVDTADMSFEAFDNESMALSGGAGIQAAQFVASKGVQVVITGNLGPNAVRTLSSAGVRMITGQAGSVKECIDKYKEGKLNEEKEPDLGGQYGMGRKMGCGGLGSGRNAAGKNVLSRQEAGALSQEKELNSLKNMIVDLGKKIEAMESKLNNMDKG
jgi:predicted Fe-Mo cluster-binding NifX family protein